MDADNFDRLARVFGLQAARRGIVAILLGGTVGTLLPDPDETAARRGRQKHAAPGAVAEKRKRRKKKKKKKKHGQPGPGAPSPRDEAPACNGNTCPLPPSCIQATLETCATALFDDLVVAAAPCQIPCQDAGSAACKACTDPIVAEYGPQAIPCVTAACTGPAPRAGRQADAPIVVGAWWTRTCDGACCSSAYRACNDDARDAFGICLGAEMAGIAAFGPAALPGLLACVGLLAYEMERCRAREGCVDGVACMPDNTCCQTATCNGACCRDGATCTYGSYQGVPREICCATTPLELGACDGVCCGTPVEVSKCCPGKSNPCVALHVAC